MGDDDEAEDARPVLPQRPKSHHHRPAPEPPSPAVFGPVTFTPVEPLSLKPHAMFKVRVVVRSDDVGCVSVMTLCVCVCSDDAMCVSAVMTLCAYLPSAILQ